VLSFVPMAWLLDRVGADPVDGGWGGAVWTVFGGFYYPLYWLIFNVEFVNEFYKWYQQLFLP